MKKIIVTIIAIFGAFAIQGQINYGTNTITGTNASAIGDGNTASGTASFAGGINSEAAGLYSIAFGNEAKAEQRNGISLGYRTFVYGPYAVGIGENVMTTCTSAMVIGSGADDDNPLVNGETRSLMIGYNSDIPTLFVGPSDGVGTVGKVGIGTSTPSSLLDINGTLHVEDDATFSNKLTVGNKITTPQLKITANAGSGKVLTSDSYGNASWEELSIPENVWSENGGNIFVQDANVGIGTSDPQAKLQLSGGDFLIDNPGGAIIMKSSGGQCWKATVSDEGQWELSPTACVSKVHEQKNMQAQPVVIFPNPAGGELKFRKLDTKQYFAGIVNPEGILLKTLELTDKETSFSLAAYPDGVYIVRITDSHNKLVQTEKIIKE